MVSKVIIVWRRKAIRIKEITIIKRKIKSLE